MVCKALRDHGVTAPIDVHLMVSPVDRIIGDFADAGATFITFHPEATNHIDRSLQVSFAFMHTYFPCPANSYTHFPPSPLTIHSSSSPEVAKLG